MSCEDVTADYPADTSAGIYDAGSYDRMMGDQDADEEDAEIKNKPLSRSVPLLFHISSDLFPRLQRVTFMCLMVYLH